MFSFIRWLIKLTISRGRKDFIKRYLRIKNIKTSKGEEIKRSDLDDFCDQHLRQDGVFFLQMLAINAGDVVASDVVALMFNNYQIKLSKNSKSAEIV